jgi:hypothetical protein
MFTVYLAAAGSAACSASDAAALNDPPTAGDAAFLSRTGKAADQSKALRQGRRAAGVLLLLQQIKASLDHFVLAETKGLAEALWSGSLPSPRRREMVRIAPSGL